MDGKYIRYYRKVKFFSAKIKLYNGTRESLHLYKTQKQYEMTNFWYEIPINF